jgi:small subunit ribosomal protein S18
VSETTASTENAPEPAATTAPAPSESAPSIERESRPSYGDRDSGPPSGGDRGRDERPRRRSGGGGGGRFGRRRVCSFCVDKVDSIDYKEPAKLRRYISDRGKIEPRRKTGTCAKHQRMLTLALKRARHVALLPFTAQHIQLTGVFPTRS